MASAEAAREAARDKMTGRFGEQHLADPGTGVLGDQMPGIPVVGLPEQGRYEATLLAISQLHPDRLTDAFEVDTVEEAVAAGLRQLAEAGTPGQPDGCVPFGEELDLIDQDNPYPVVECEDWWPATPQTHPDEMDVRQVGNGRVLPSRTWKLADGRWLTIEPRFFTVAELVTVGADGTIADVTVLDDEHDANQWEAELAGAGGHQYVQYRAWRELKVDLHDQPDVAEGSLDTCFEWRQATGAVRPRSLAFMELFEFASGFDWAEAPSGRWAKDMWR